MTRPRRKLVILALVIVVLAAAYYAVFWPCWIKPVAWTPEPDPGMTGVYAPNTALSQVDRLAKGIDGPEDVELGPDGWIYASLRNGSIVRFDPQHADTFETFADTHGFPLGLEFDAHDHLIVADGDRGILDVSPDGRIDVLLEGLNGARFRFADDLAIAEDGTIWFSDSYQRGPADLRMNAWEGDATGRVIAFDRGSGHATVHLDGLMFANGITLGPNEDYLLVAELFGARLTRLWLSGPHRGEHDVFIDALPGYPDNIAFDGSDTFWVALVSPRTPAFERWSRYPFVRAFVAKAPLFLAPHPIPSLASHQYCGWVVGVDTTGVVRYNLQSPSGGYGAITSANAFGDWLYLGSIRMDSVARLELGRLQPLSTP